MSNLFTSKGGYRTKPLKGGSVASNIGVFDTIEANNVKFENVTIEGVMEDAYLVNAIIEESLIRTTTIGLDGPAAAKFTELTATATVLFLGENDEYVLWDPETGEFYISNNLHVDGCSLLGNIEICNNTISSDNSNGDIFISPNGTGTTYINSGAQISSSNGNFTVQMSQGQVSIQAKNNVNLVSSTGSASITSNLDQTFTSHTGSITFNATLGHIALNSGSITVPEYAKVSFGDSCNSIVGSGNNIVISGCDAIELSSESVKINDGSLLTFGTSGATIESSTSSLIITSDTLNVKSTDTTFVDPILTIANYTTGSNDGLDRGIEFKYTNTAGNMALGWFGYKNTTGDFTFLLNATNSNEVISGQYGNLEVGNLTLSSTLANLNMNCGTINDVSNLIGCEGELNIYGEGTVNINATSQVYINASAGVLIPNNVALKLGTNGNKIISTTVNNLEVSSINNIYLNTTNGVIIPSNTKVSFDGTTTGSQSIISNTNGELLVKSNNNIYLTTTGGNIIVPSNTHVQFGASSQSLYGNSGGMTLTSLNSGASMTITSNSCTSIVTSFGNIDVTNYSGDINLNPNGSVRLPTEHSLVFALNGTRNSIMSSNGTLVVTGSSGNAISFQQFDSINLSAESAVNVPVNTRLNIGTSYVYNDTSSNLYVSNPSTSGSINISGKTTNLSNTNGSLNVINNATSVSSESMIISGSTASSTTINSQNLLVRDPIVTIANYTTGSNDFFDRGIEYRYNTNGNMALGWFGFKNTTGNFTFYSSAINTNEIVTGTLGNIQINNVYANNLSLNSTGGSLDLNCGQLLNVDIITACGSTLDISSSNLIIHADNRVEIPYDTLLAFGTGGNIIQGSTSGMYITSSNIMMSSNVEINGTITNIYTTNTRLYDPIATLADYILNSNDGLDRGIEFLWYDSVSNSQKLGFFGFDNSIGRFVFVKDATNNLEVISGQYSDAQFGNIWANSLDLGGGSIGNVTLITSNSTDSLIVSSANVTFTSEDVYLTNGSTLHIGSATITSSTDSLIISSGTIDLSSSDGVVIPENIPLQFGTNGTYIMNTDDNLLLTSNTGNITLQPAENVFIPTNTNLNFANTGNGIYSDGNQLYIYGSNLASITVPQLTINADVTIQGDLNFQDTVIDQNAYMLELGTDQVINITSIGSTVTTGVYYIQTLINNYLGPGDQVLLADTQTTPLLDGTYTVVNSSGPNIFLISSGSTLTSFSAGGTIRSDLTYEQGKDVGIIVNYWSTVGNTSVTSGTANFKTGFFGFDRSSERWVYYSNATINNNVVVGGSLSDLEINKLYANKLNGFVLEGAMSAGSNAVMGSNFQIAGGSINGTPIGAGTASTGRFTSLVNTTNSTLNNVAMASNMSYSFQRYTLSNTSANLSPNVSVITSMFKVVGSNVVTTGTMPSTSVPDGTLKILVCTSMGTGSTYTLYFGPDKLITPNPFNTSVNPTQITFKRQSQSAQLIYDSQACVGGAWILLSSGGYVS